MRTLVAGFTTAIALLGAEAAGTKTVTKADDGGSVTIDRGGTLKVRLKQLDSGGYVWRTKRKPDGDVLVLTKTRTVYQQCTEEPCPVGMPSTFVATYRGLNRGTTKIRLIYKRPFEDQVEDRFILTVRVK